MIAMTRGTGRRAQIAAFDLRFVMNARFVSGELVRGNAVRLHVIAVGVAALAGLGNLEGMYAGERIIRRTDPVYSVAIDAHGDVGVARSKLLAVHARLVLRE